MRKIVTVDDKYKLPEVLNVLPVFSESEVSEKNPKPPYLIVESMDGYLDASSMFKDSWRVDPLGGSAPGDSNFSFEFTNFETSDMFASTAPKTFNNANVLLFFSDVDVTDYDLTGMYGSVLDKDKYLLFENTITLFSGESTVYMKILIVKASYLEYQNAPIHYHLLFKPNTLVSKYSAVSFSVGSYKDTDVFSSLPSTSGKPPVRVERGSNSVFNYSNVERTILILKDENSPIPSTPDGWKSFNLFEDYYVFVGPSSSYDVLMVLGEGSQKYSNVSIPSEIPSVSESQTVALYADTVDIKARFDNVSISFVG